MNKLKYSLIFLTTIFAMAVYAQPGPGPWMENGPRREKMRKRLETVKIW